MPDRKTHLRNNQPAHTDEDERAVVSARRGRPKGSYSPLTQWLRPLVFSFQAQDCSCRNVFLALAEEQDDWDLYSFHVSAETADAYRHELTDDITGHRVTWASFKYLWHQLSKQHRIVAQSNNHSEVAHGR